MTSLLSRIEKMLTELEWCRDEDCPWCNSARGHDGKMYHFHDCELAALLAEVREEMKKATDWPPCPACGVRHDPNLYKEEGLLFEKREGDGGFSERRDSPFAVPPAPTEEP